MELEDLMLLIEGYFEKLKYEQYLIRKQTFIVSMTFGQKIEALEKAWPDPYKAEGKTKKMVTYKGVKMTERQMKTLIKLKDK